MTAIILKELSIAFPNNNYLNILKKILSHDHSINSIDVSHSLLYREYLEKKHVKVHGIHLHRTCINIDTSRLGVLKKWGILKNLKFTLNG